MITSLLAPPPSSPRPERSLDSFEAVSDLCLHQWFERQAAQTPEAVAVLFEEQALTYDALNRRANQLARHLQSLGVGPETLVGICLENAPEMIVGLLGILKAGGAYVPLDPAYPSERLFFMLGDAGISVLLTQDALRTRLPSGEAHLICLDTGWDAIAAHTDENFDGGAGPDNLAYVIYTSGSTGQPKGVLISHRSICNNLAWRQREFPLGSEDRLLQTYSFSFDPSVWAIFWPLIAGAAVVLPRPGGIKDSAYLVETILRFGISVLGFGPAMLQVILNEPGIERCRSLRHVFCGGEALPPTLPERFWARLAADLHNVYGPTETTIDAAWHTCRRGSRPNLVPIGRALPGARLYLLDEQGQPVPPGSPGELYVAGIGLARGYWNRPELTRERFLPDPFSSDAVSRLYRTGDLARFNSEGALEYLGRTDQQVKLRGFRIELGEIEAALVRHPQVRDAVVAVRESGAGDPRLVAYVICREEWMPDDLRPFLESRLPNYMIPALFERLETFPLTPNGKVDRAALPEPRARDGGRAARYVAPRDPLQHQIASIWEGLLGIRPVGITDSFWELGGHSLLAARLFDQIAQVCGRRLPLSALYEGATVEHMAALLRQPADGEVVRSPLARIHEQGTQTPIFFLYGFLPLGGFYCFNLARALGPEQPFFALHPESGDGRDLPPTIEGMAAYYLQILREFQPRGPYRLGGFCGAGLVAYEMARRLEVLGETVEFLALIEVQSINVRVKRALHSLSERVGKALPPAARRGLFQRLQRVLLPPALAWQNVQKKCRRKRGGAVLEDRRTQDFIDRCDSAAGIYVPAPYGGKIELFCVSEGSEEEQRDALAWWRDAAYDADVHYIAGGHLTCLTEHVHSLGQRLGERLAALNPEPTE